MPDILQPVSEILQQFGLILLRPQLQPEILVGTGNLPRYDIQTSPLNYGLYLTARAIPPNLSRTAAIEPDYTDTLVKLSFIGRMQNAQFVTVDRVYVNSLPALIRIPNLTFNQCTYEILPGVEIFLSYLVVPLGTV